MINDGSTLFRIRASASATLYRFPRAFANGHRGVMRSETMYMRFGLGYYDGYLSKSSPVRYNKVLNLMRHYSEKPVHFLYDVMPLADLCTEFVIAHPDVKILVHKSVATDVYLRRIWGDAGVNTTARFIFGGGGESYYADVMYYPHVDGWDTNERLPYAYSLTYPEAMPWMGPRLRALGASDKPWNVVLLLLRKPGRERSILNEEELLAAIRKELRSDLELVVLHDPAEWDWATTSALAYRSVLMLGPHGGALQNAAFMQPDKGAVVVELAKPQEIENFRGCFVTLARMLNLRYWLVEHPQFDYNKLFNVSVPEVMSVLRRVGVLNVSI
jgi:hypothetical protein